jgi:hypothetical protein
VSPDELGLALAKLVLALLVPAGAPITGAVDDTMIWRYRKKVWPSRGSTTDPCRASGTGRGNNWVIAAIVVRLPMISRPATMPVLAKLSSKTAKHHGTELDRRGGDHLCIWCDAARWAW